MPLTLQYVRQGHASPESRGITVKAHELIDHAQRIQKFCQLRTVLEQFAQWINDRVAVRGTDGDQQNRQKRNRENEYPIPQIRDPEARQQALEYIQRDSDCAQCKEHRYGLEHRRREARQKSGLFFASLEFARRQINRAADKRINPRVFEIPDGAEQRLEVLALRLGKSLDCLNRSHHETGAVDELVIPIAAECHPVLADTRILKGKAAGQCTVAQVVKRLLAPCHFIAVALQRITQFRVRSQLPYGPLFFP